MLHTFEGWFCSTKLLDFLYKTLRFPIFCYCTFLYRLILGTSCYALIYNSL